uniref:Uncharacterized protein LOC105034354 n=1 Tax=Elaeis guineensis var. tenera TaxID=51953 RepID=A0A6I9QFF4_ELAGV|nr:uncharacterized protein LOC105034354 [Elaeis guineensis]
MGLDDCYGVVRSQILSTEPLPSLNKAYALVSREEEEQSLVANRSSMTDAAAFIVKNSCNNKQISAKSGGQRTKCDNCGKLVHRKETCFELIGYPADWRSKGRSLKGHKNSDAIANNASSGPLSSSTETHESSPITGLTREQNDQLMSLLSISKSSIVNFVGPSHEEAHWNG